MFGVFIDGKLKWVYDSWVEADDEAKRRPGAMVRRVCKRARFTTTAPVLWYDAEVKAAFSIAYHDGRLVIHSVHGSPNGSLVIRDEMTNMEYTITPDALLQIARRMGCDQVIIVPCYPNRVRAQLNEPRVQVVGGWDSPTLLYKRRYGYAEAYEM